MDVTLLGNVILWHSIVQTFYFLLECDVIHMYIFFAKVCICLIQYWHMYILNVQSLSYISLMKVMWYKIPHEIIVNIIVFEQHVSFCWYLCLSLLILCEWIGTLALIETGSSVVLWWMYVHIYTLMCVRNWIF